MSEMSGYGKIRQLLAIVSGEAGTGKSNLIRKTNHYLHATLPNDNAMTRMMLPLQVSVAKTVHKAQGATYNKAMINFDRMITAGQVYAALRRVRTTEGVYIRSTRWQPSIRNPLRPSAYKMNSCDDKASIPKLGQ
jgi:hypothetical protein